MPLNEDAADAPKLHLITAVNTAAKKNADRKPRAKLLRTALTTHGRARTHG